MKIPETLKMPSLCGFWERNHKVFSENKVHLVSLVLSLVFKTVYGLFLTHLVDLKTVK
jgi:hypothetical protein